jgi:YD repeat-containing protein
MTPPNILPTHIPEPTPAPSGERSADMSSLRHLLLGLCLALTVPAAGALATPLFTPDIPPTGIIDPLGQITTIQTGYDKLGRKRTETDQNGRTTRWSYDDLGRRPAAPSPKASAKPSNTTPGPPHRPHRLQRPHHPVRIRPERAGDAADLCRRRQPRPHHLHRRRPDRHRHPERGRRHPTAHRL